MGFGFGFNSCSLFDCGCRCWFLGFGLRLRKPIVGGYIVRSFLFLVGINLTLRVGVNRCGRFT